MSGDAFLPLLSGNGSGVGHGDSDAGAVGDDRNMELMIVKQPPSHAFAGDWFELELRLDASEGESGSSSSGTTVEIHLELHLCDASGSPLGEPETDVAKLTADPARIQLSVGESATTVRSKIDVPDLSTDHKTYYCVKISKKYDAQDSSSAGNIVQPVFTKGVHVVNHMIDLTPTDWEPIWYKDEGGRDKCMQVEAGLRDRDGSLVYGKKVPLRLTLMYDNGKTHSLRVIKQEILRVLGTQKDCIDPDTATAQLRFRVEDVSKNHQGQNFIVEVAPLEAEEGFADVAPAYTPSVSVRSKRNKRQRQTSLSGQMGVSSQEESGTSKGPPGSASVGVKPPYKPGGTASSQSQPEGFSGVADVPRLREAMKGVIQWTEEVVNGLYPLQWQVIGYAQFPDGSVDYSRPFHSMPNPNACISRVLSMYSDSTREHLRVILAAVENTRQIGREADHHQDHSVSSSLGATIPRGGPDETYPLGRPSASASMPRPMAPHVGGQEKPSPSMYARPAPPQQMPVPAAQSPYTGVGTIPSEPYASMKKPRMDSSGMYGQQMGIPTGQHMPGHPPPGHPRHPSPRMMDMAPVPMRATARMDEGFEGDDSREGEVEYVLAKQYKALRTGERLGFPAYSASKEILGFYRESSMKVGVGQFIPISRHREEFGPMEMHQASRILEDAIANNNQAVHRLKDWGSISSLVDHALVYDWSKSLGGNNNSAGSGPD